MTHVSEAAAAAPQPEPNAQPTVSSRGGMAVFTEGQVYPQFFVLMFVNVAMLMGAVLPWHGGPDAGTGLFTFAGAIIGYLSIGALLSSISSIYSRKLVIWPTLVNWLVADCFITVGLMDLFKNHSDVTSKLFSAEFKEGLQEIGSVLGVGFVFILAAGVFMLFFMVFSVFSGARTQSKKKKAAQASRASTRKSSRK